MGTFGQLAPKRHARSTLLAPRAFVLMDFALNRLGTAGPGSGEQEMAEAVTLNRFTLDLHVSLPFIQAFNWKQLVSV